jgi:hypothetical protein
MDDGFNPMKWNCETQGCFNVKRRPRIEVFHDCFPGKINFGDVDGIVEIAGRGLMIEWKTSLIDLPFGQKTMYKRLTQSKLITVFIFVGNAETMQIDQVASYIGGRFADFQDCNLERAKEMIRLWADAAISGNAIDQ